MKTKIGMVESSGGRLVIDLSNGEVLNYFVDDPEYKSQFESIKKFDMEEWKKRYPFDQHIDAFDILDLGYWYKNDNYEPPEESFRYQSHWDHVHELKQILIDKVMDYIQLEIDGVPKTDAISVMLNHLPIPDLYHYLPETNNHQNELKYLIDNKLTDYHHNYTDGNQYLEGMICPNCRTPIEIFDEECDNDWIQYDCNKCESLITIKKKGD